MCLPHPASQEPTNGSLEPHWTTFCDFSRKSFGELELSAIGLIRGVTTKLGVHELNGQRKLALPGARQNPGISCFEPITKTVRPSTNFRCRYCRI